MLRSGDSGRFLPVTLLVAAAPILSVAPAGLVFTTSAGVTPAAGQRHYIAAPTASTAVAWQAAATEPWLRVSAASGLAAAARPGSLDVTLASAALPPGEFRGAIRVTASGLPAQNVAVLLRILPNGSIPPVSLDASALLATPGAPVGFVLSNAYQGPVSYFTGRDFGGDPFSWFSLTPPSSAIEAGGAQAVSVDIRSSLDPGVRRGLVTVSFAGTQRILEVTSIQPAANCRPSRLLPTLITPGTDETVVLGWPVPVEARVADDCGQFLAAGSVTLATPDGGVPLMPAGEGRWVGTWTPAGAAQLGPAALTLAARAAASALEGVSSRAVAVVGEPRPGLSGGAVSAVVSAGTFSRYRPVAPGGFVTVLGSGLAGPAGEPPTVTLGGQNVEVTFASGSQLNLRVPDAAPAGQLLPLVIQRPGWVSVPEFVVVAQAAPDVFVSSEGGRVQSVITDPAFRLITPSNAVGPGDAVVIFCTGLGTLPIAVPIGVVVGGVPAEVIGAAGAPGYPGLYQVAVRIGALTPAGPDTLVQLSAGGRLSPPVPLATRR